jgi:hypothetical protein
MEDRNHRTAPPALHWSGRSRPDTQSEIVELVERAETDADLDRAASTRAAALAARGEDKRRRK